MSHSFTDNIARVMALYARTAVREFIRQSLAALLALSLAITGVGMVSAASVIALASLLNSVSLALVVVAVAHLLLAIFIAASIFLHHRKY